MRALFLAGLLSSPAFGAEAAKPAPYLDQLSVEATRALHARAGRDPGTLRGDEEKKDWAAARLAWIALARLQAKEAEALTVFRGCEKLCEKYGNASEWKATKGWACAKDPKASACGN